MNEKNKNYYKTSEAAALLGVAVSTVQLWTNNGALRAWTTDGGHRRIERTSVDDMLAQQHSNNTAASGMPAHCTPAANHHTNKNLIYLALSLGEPRLKKELIVELNHARYRVESFSDFYEIRAACEKEQPMAIMVDLAFNDGELTGLELISQLKENIEVCPFLFFISEYDTPEFRLAAVHAGADRYFCKPLEINKVIHTLTAIKTISAENVKPYRVLLIDDERPLLNLYTTVLNNAGMVVETSAIPFDALALIDSFQPDVIVVDVFMHECSGPELLSMIRQDDKWSLIPVILVSGNKGFKNQLDVMDLGADDFLVKPVSNNDLVMTVSVTAKRARNNLQLNYDLKNALRENKYQLVSLNQHALVSSTDVAGRITHANKKFCEVSGYSFGELIGQNHRLLKSNHHPDAFYAELWHTISNGEVWHGTLCNRKKNGGEYWVESTIVPFLNDKGKPYKYVSVRTDITSHRQSEERLEKSQKFANIGTWDWNILTGTLFWSDRIWSLFGYTNENTDSTYDMFLNAIHPDDRDKVVNAVTRCIDVGDDYEIEHRVVWPDGSIHWMHEQGDVLRNEAGEALHMLGVVQDISDRKRSEQFLLAAREEAENANHAKSQFLASMSHELRTPMNAIIGFSQILKMETKNPLSEVQQQHVNEILTAGNHLMGLINQVLDLARIESGHIDMTIEDVFLGNVVNESLHLIMPLAQRNGIEINLTLNNSEITYDELLQNKLIVKADHSRLKQILINLLSNAVKYNSKNGQITLACTSADNHQLRISITDTGAGLTAEQQNQLFTSFNRLGAEQSDIEGSGIGLVITKNIIKLMGGQIGVACEVDKGCTFWIEMPLGMKYVEPLVNVADKIINDIPHVNDEAKNKAVLYIEDNPANLRLVSSLLKRLPNVQVLEAHDGILGIDLALEHEPDLILLDINLPGLDGFGVLKLLRENEVTHKIPVIAISANAMPEDINKGFKAGFDDYITKPIDITAMLLAVDKMLSGHQH